MPLPPVCQLASDTILFPLACKAALEYSRQNGRGTGPRRHAKKRSGTRWQARVNFALSGALLWDAATREGPGSLANRPRGGDHGGLTEKGA
jgi:hypothetical protein